MKTSRKSHAAAPLRVSIAPVGVEQGGATVMLPAKGNATSQRTLDLSAYLGRGIDAWVWACTTQLRAFLAGGGATPATVRGYWVHGLVHFFNFLIMAGVPCQPGTLERKHIAAFIAWLSDHTDWAYTSQRSFYTRTKAVLNGLQRRDVVPGCTELFPANPFPHSNARQKGATPLSTSERARMAAALRDDIIAIHKQQFNGTASAALIVYLLAIAVRTGANTTPLLEMKRNCLKPHPFISNMMLLETFKRRGNATQIRSLRFSKEEDRPLAVAMDGVGLVRKVLAMTQPLADAARDDLKDFVWLYIRTGVGSNSRELTRLSGSALCLGIQALIDRHQLKADDGAPLQINPSRLRKTMEDRLWQLSGGDLIVTAALMGHTPQVADNHYLACTNSMREDATFVGEALPEIYRNGEHGDDNGKVIPIVPITATRVGGCKDPYYGDKAPCDGTPCDDFFTCFSCRSYAIVGTPDDLHRLFSFYWFLEREKYRARSSDWRTQFHHTMRLIDSFTADSFDLALVQTAKERARVDPHIFWKSYVIDPDLTDLEHG
ncbi:MULTISPECIES: hypothetical protein [Paraburkholderia]|uniref:Integrase n=1 Tax=Paraburkholderia madseniana TaxID=2599607 RepID=A0AAP5BM30_9BURK|nr:MULTISPECIES: hypothetical protein [Paraburkholderia]MCX4151523.1 hypothetical protein [Paraburkholderia madseniana]MDN7154454.1 hypothetical protein [Paraburkholderia sp. WS6]MDQ6413336.1 hypothetical protein [Paraburkholderia madseniana]